MKRSYRVLARLGEGGMATVYLALIGGDRGFRKLVALKVLRDHPGIDFAELREMFAHEARVSARCHHRNVVQIQDVCELDGKPALCMEFLDGQTYRQVRARASKAGGLPLFEQLRILAEAAHGLHHVHTLTDYEGRPLGLVHCDVSPENVFVTYDGQVKLLDFGIAQAHSDAPRAPGFRGKLTYLAPELITGEPIDARADVFALGAMLWEAVSVAPFSGGPTVDDLTKLRTRLAGGEANIRGVQPGAPERLAEIVDRAVALDPKQRFANAEAFACALEDYLSWAGAQPSAQSLSKLVVPMFERERAKQRALVDPQLQLADRWDREHEAPSADREPPRHVGAVPSEPDAGFDFVLHGPPAPSAPEQAYAYSSPADTVDPESSSRWRWRSRWTSVALLLTVATLGAFGGVLLGFRDAQERVLQQAGRSPSASSSPARGTTSAPVAATHQRTAAANTAQPSPASRQQTPSSADSTVQVRSDVPVERASLTSEACVTTARTLKEELHRLANDLVRSQERRARHAERRARRRAAQCAAGRTEKC